MIKLHFGALKLKKHFILGAGILLAGAAILFLSKTLNKARTIDFYRSDLAVDAAARLNFRVDAAADRIFFLQKDGPRELKGIPTANACFFRLEGRKTFSLRSPFSGRTGFYSHVYLDGLDKGKISFKIGVKRKGRALNFRQIRAGEFNAPVFLSMSLAKDEQLEISCQGTGIVYFSKPILYRIKHEQKRDYIFLIGVDTLRADPIGSMVNGRPLTPNIDRFKLDSVDFARCYSQSSWTLPAFMSLFTAQYEFHHQMSRGSALDPDKPFLVKELAAKYVTLNINGGIYMSKNFGFARHFDFFEASPALAGSYGGKVLFNKALDLIDRAQFPASFMFLHTYQIHSPYAPPAKFLEQINAHPRNTELKSIPFGLQKKRFMPVDDALTRSYKELYRGEVLAFDSFFGDFIAALKQRGIYDRSLIVLMSDHGEEFFEHRGWDHGHTLYDELLHVPLVIKFPGERNKGLAIKENVGVIDILPTILSAAGIGAASGPVDGMDLVPLMKGGKLERPYLFSSIANCSFIREIPPKFAIITDRFKVIYNYDYSAADLKFFAGYTLPPQTGQVEIYDLQRDKSELMNLFAKRKDVYRQVSQVIKKIRALIDANLAMKKDKNRSESDRDLQKQLKSLGYL